MIMFETRAPRTVIASPTYILQARRAWALHKCVMEFQPVNIYNHSQFAQRTAASYQAMCVMSFFFLSEVLIAGLYVSYSSKMLRIQATHSSATSSKHFGLLYPLAKPWYYAYCSHPHRPLKLIIATVSKSHTIYCEHTRKATALQPMSRSFRHHPLRPLRYLWAVVMLHILGFGRHPFQA